MNDDGCARNESGRRMHRRPVNYVFLEQPRFGLRSHARARTRIGYLKLHCGHVRIVQSRREINPIVRLYVCVCVCVRALFFRR